MNTSKQFVVTFTASDGDEWDLNESYLYALLTDTIGFSGPVWVSSVKRLVPPGKVFTSKISAIKEIRSLLELSLIDAKHMADAAQAMGEFQLMKIIVTYDHDSGKYVVTNTR